MNQYRARYCVWAFDKVWPKDWGISAGIGGWPEAAARTGLKGDPESCPRGKEARPTNCKRRSSADTCLR